MFFIHSIFVFSDPPLLFSLVRDVQFYLLSCMYRRVLGKVQSSPLWAIVIIVRIDLLRLSGASELVKRLVNSGRLFYFRPVDGESCFLLSPHGEQVKRALCSPLRTSRCGVQEVAGHWLPFCHWPTRGVFFFLPMTWPSLHDLFKDFLISLLLCTEKSIIINFKWT